MMGTELLASTKSIYEIAYRLIREIQRLEAITFRYEIERRAKSSHSRYVNGMLEQKLEMLSYWRRLAPEVVAAAHRSMEYYLDDLWWEGARWVRKHTDDWGLQSRARRVFTPDYIPF